MINPTKANMALTVNVSGPHATRWQLRPLLMHMVRPAHYGNRVTIEARNDFIFESGNIAPSREQCIWLHQNMKKGWEGVLSYNKETDSYDLVMSFEDDGEAMLYRMRW